MACSGGVNWGEGGLCWLVWGAVLVLQVLAAAAQRGAFPDLTGNYCRFRRPQECCDGRYDQCAVPIRGTLCYCDHFCDRTVHPDCCPDYWEVCQGYIPPPEFTLGCHQDGLHLLDGESYRVNCNLCTCVGNNLQCEQDRCMVDQAVLSQVNQNPRHYGWTATNYTKFWGRKMSQGLVLRTGTLNPEALSLRMYPILLQPQLSRIPRQFDARQAREWIGRVGGARDQGWCGASWTFSTLAVAQDRLAIESEGKEVVQLSPQHLLSCDRRGQSGCTGGHIDRAWQYLRRIGVVNDDCFRYESGRTGKVPQCRIPRSATLQTMRCVPQTVYKGRKELYQTEPSYRISGKEEDIQWEIMTNGPVQALMKVHPDLFMYAGGVYSHSGLGATETSTHSVRLVGWGEDSSLAPLPTKYWIAANSWGQDWGENGFFRIRRGTNESDIETFILAVRVQLPPYFDAQFGDGRRRRHHRHSRP